MDAITMLKDDHRSVEKLFKRFEQTGDRAMVERRRIVDRIIEELSVHAAIEEQLFYPVTRATVDGVEDDVLESLEEHHVAKWLLDELQHLDPEDERFKAKVTVLIESVRHHIAEEEGDYFPRVRDALGRNDLAELGEAMADARASAPTRPHPNAPDTPPGNVIVGAAAGFVDRVADTVNGVAQGGVSAAHDLIARFTGRPRPRTSPSGSPTARKVATKVRASVEDATEQAAATGEATVRTAATGTKRTVAAAKGAATSTRRAASSGAEETASTATGAAKKTAKTAKTGAKRTRSTATGAAARTADAARSAS